MTLSVPTTQEGKIKLKRLLDGLRHDNLNIVKRPGFREMEKEVVPEVKVAFRSRAKEIPPELRALDAGELEKLWWPRSPFVWEIYRQQVEPYKTIGQGPEVNYLDSLKDIDACWRPSTTFSLNLELTRNKRALKKAQGLPYFGKKGEHMDGNIQYSSGLKSESDLARCWSIVPGYRTSQSQPGKEKVRLVWAVPGHMWVKECEAYDDAISKTITESQRLVHQIQVMYFDVRQGMKQWMSKFSNRVVCWLYVDSKQYDSTVEGSELAAAVQYFASGYEAAPLLAAYLAKADIVMPDGVVSRQGGMPSGSKLTNLGDGWTNVGKTLHAFSDIKLDKHIVCVLVNGDDITVGLDTLLSASNVESLAKHVSPRVVEAAKCKIQTSLYNSKWWCDGKILTRSIFRALNSLMFKEREASALSVNAVYVAIARASIMLDIEEHPLYEVLAKGVAKYEEVTLADALDKDERANETLEYYITTHDYVGDVDVKQFKEKLLNSRYAREFSS